VAAGDDVDDAHDEAAHDGARNRVEPAQDHHGKHLEADQREVHVDAEHVAPQHAAQRRDDAGHRPRQPEVALDVDAHGHGHLLVVGHRPHGDALPRLQEEPAEAGQEYDAHEAAHELDRRDEERADDERLVTDGQHQRLGAGADGGGPDPPQDGGQADGGHDDGDDRPSDELAEHDALE